MKRLVILLCVLCMLCMTACAEGAVPLKPQSEDAPYWGWDTHFRVQGLNPDDYLAYDPDAVNIWKMQRRMFRSGDSLYICTGLKSDLTGRCGVMDDYIATTVSKYQEPQQDKESNFGTEYGLQYVQDGADLWEEIDGKIQYVRYVRVNEEDDWGLTLTPMYVTPSGMLLLITRYGGEVEENLVYNDVLSIERYDAETDSWEAVKDLPDDAYTDDTHAALHGCTVVQYINWKRLYGELPPGSYRMVKEFFPKGDKAAMREYTVEFYLA